MQRVASRIEAVTVYRAGALVSRVAELSAGPEGLPDTVQIIDLPLSLDDSSVRVGVSPSAGEDATAVLPEADSVRIALDVPAPDSAPEPVAAEALMAARREEQRLRDDIARVERDLERLAELAMPIRPAGEQGKPPPPSPTASRLALLEFRSDRARELRDRRRAVRDQLRAATATREELEERDRRASSDREAKEHELRKSAIVRLRGERAASVRLTVEYLVPGARWAPSYSIRFDPDLKSADLAVRAVVCQRTGEDWQGVALALSTARLQRWSELPELRSIRIGRVQPPAPRTGWRPPPLGSQALYGDYDRSFASAAPQSGGDPHDSDTTPLVTGGVEVPERIVDAPWYDDRSDVTDEYELPPYSDSLPREFDDQHTQPARPATLSESMPPAPSAKPPGGPPPAAQTVLAAAAPSRSMDAAGAAPPADMFSRRMAPSKKRATRPVRGGGGGGGEAPAVALEEPELRTSEKLLAYGNLRMPAADEPRRGRLVISDLSERYLALLVRMEVQVTVDVLAVIARATERARAAARVPLPPRHLAPSDEDGFDYVYRAETSADIPSDGSYHALPVSQHQADARSRYVVVPRESTDVFRQAELQCPLDAPLLAGPADVYVGENFLITTDLRATPARGKLRLGLGVEQGLKVARNTRFEEKSAGLMRGSLSLRHEIRVEVGNRLDRPAQVEVRERVPIPAVADSDEVEVVLGEVEPAWRSYEQPDAPIRGGYRWEREIPAGGEAVFEANYEVRIAAKHELVGGNRREQ